MGRDRHEPPPGLTEEELRRWHQWRKFTWLPGDIQIIRTGDGEKSGEDANRGRDDEQPGGRWDTVNPVYLGVDVAGAKNTWMMGLSPGSDGLAVVDGPRKASLATIAGYCEENNVVAATIDAQLTAALSEENGFRESDMELREMLLRRQGSRNWVASAAGLLAVPVRGRLLAEHLSPTVGTVIETHPRASLLFALGEEFLVPIREYKKGDETAEAHTRTLWRAWSEAFGVLSHEPVYHDGALDSLVCATVAYLYHHDPSALHKLRHEVAGKVGRGPFYVLAPDAKPRA